MPMYPVGPGYSTVLPARGFGFQYTFSGENASVSAQKEGDFTVQGGEYDWGAEQLMNTTSEGILAFDVVRMIVSSFEDTLSANASLFVATDGWNVSSPGNKSYAEQVGFLGLGSPDSYHVAGLAPSNRSSILQQFETSGDIGSNSFGLHIGSVSQNVKGSLVLGGYDQNRVIGPVGSLVSDEGDQAIPYAFLMDVALGGARCDSPYSSLSGGSIDHLFKGTNNGNSDDITTAFGGPTGSAPMIPNPSYPYISLPIGSCEAIASHLPVTWNASLGFYTWNQQDPAFPKLINSSTYLDFILSDSTARNFSIKVPFQLLNLTLESPIVDTPTPYFPCVPVNSSQELLGSWMLGRAFLQAAFFGINYDTNSTFLAQAPGPASNGTKLTPINPTDTSITAAQSDSLDALVASWQQTWTPANCAQESAGGSHNGTIGGNSATPSSAISTGAIAGIAVGGLAVIIILSASAYVYYRRRRRNGPIHAPKGGNGGADAHGKFELPNSQQHKVSEAPGECMKVEMLGQERYEAVGSRLDHELGSTEKFEAGGGEMFELPAGAWVWGDKKNVVVTHEEKEVTKM
ncbi:hypothetical protein MMC10_004770 [Thelotrema lepadinum]|nr:hypothetical protein [Thelotrema lepadinum]